MGLFFGKISSSQWHFILNRSLIKCFHIRIKKYFFLFFLIANINYPITNKCDSKHIISKHRDNRYIDRYSLHDFYSYNIVYSIDSFHLISQNTSTISQDQAEMKLKSNSYKLSIRFRVFITNHMPPKCLTNAFFQVNISNFLF